MTTIQVVVALVALERLAELVWAARNTKSLLEQGGHEVGRAHYPLLVLLHATWLGTTLIAAPANGPVLWPAMAVFAAMQPLRLWVLATLGRRWTTRIIVLPDAPLIARGPYRFVSHPNYMIVVCEIAALPIAFGEWGVAFVFTLLNAMVLGWRIKVEEEALAPYRSLSR